MSTPEAQRKARKAYRDRKKEAGEKLVSFMLSVEAAAALPVLMAGGKSKNAAINAALIAAAKGVQKPVYVADELREMAIRNNEPGPVTKEIRRASAQAAQKPAPSQGLKGDGATHKISPHLPVGPQPFKPRLKTKK